jgi:formate dehydrogenase major subunit
MVMELLLADQPEREDAHDRSAHFWDMAERTASTKAAFPALSRARSRCSTTATSPMRVNLDACIQCNLCVRACREVQVNDVIGMAGRGHDA